ncbi:LysE family translocator [Corynebacterium sp.]|uniref:LysE family translocator n=1 Tax=Corynebacterium sp. TaxID=1720 RepID=UPI0028B1C97C|nr:LysE family translocator [Corynebacterium sp.]
MLTWTQLAVFIPAALAVAASPGANNLLAFRNGLRSGFVKAILALIGRFTAFAIMLTLVVSGLGAVLQTSQVTFEVLRVVGAFFMVGFGAWIIWSARAKRGDNDDEKEASETHQSSTHPLKLAAQEFITAGANPKALLLFTAFLPPFVDTSANHASAGVQLALFGVLYIICEAAMALMWAGSGRLLAARGIKNRTLRRLDQASGGALVAFGGGLAVSDLSRR